MAKNDEKRAIRCSFCGKHQDQVTKIIAGPGAYICNECVQLCMDILDNMAAPEEQLAGTAWVFRMVGLVQVSL